MLATWCALVAAAACTRSNIALNARAVIEELEPWGSRNLSYSGLPNPKKDGHGLRCGKFTRQEAARLVTAIVPAYPRHEDASGRGMLKLQQTVKSIQGVLGMEEAQIIVNFDAFPDGESSFTSGDAKAYREKIAEVKDWNSRSLGGNLTIFTNSEWTHRTETLHRVFDWMKASGTLTPLVFVAPEESALDGLIDVALILRTLGCDAEVDYVRFLRVQDCIMEEDSGENLPCLEHTSTPLLHSVDRLNDRPHFATASFYLDFVFENIPRSYRGLPGDILRSAPHMWAYGKRGHMARDADGLGDWYEKAPQPSHTKQREFGLMCHKSSWEEVPKLVTAIVPTAARKQDADGAALEALQQTIMSIRSSLRVARIVVAFDAVPNATMGDPLTLETIANYKQKVLNLEHWDPNLTIFVNEEWTHETELLRRVFDLLLSQGKLPPFLYVAQDDSPVSGEIDVPLILTMLSCDPAVDYVRFLWADDCSEGHATNWNEPCEQHPTTPFLHSVGRMSDRPHLATSAFYQDTIFKPTPRNYRGTPERTVITAPNLWIYGKRSHMHHETNVLRSSYNRDRREFA